MAIGLATTHHTVRRAAHGRTLGILGRVGLAAQSIGAAKTLAGAGSRTGGEHSAAAGILGWPAGRELVGFIATVLAVTACVLVYWALSRRFEESLLTSELDRRTTRVVQVTGVVG